MLKYEHSPSVGEIWCPTPEKERVRLNNVEIDMDTAVLFLKWQQIPMKITFSDRQTKRRWGTAWKDRIVLYRHSVWMFLHEIAHVVAGPEARHDRTFGLVLHGLYLKWQEVNS